MGPLPHNMKGALYMNYIIPMNALLFSAIFTAHMVSAPESTITPPKPGEFMIGTRNWETGEDINDPSYAARHKDRSYRAWHKDHPHKPKDSGTVLPSQKAQRKACNAAIDKGESNPDIIGACELE